MECLLKVGVIGVNFKMADLALREKIARAIVPFSKGAGRFFSHCIVPLSTCNRTEIYFSSSDLAEAHSDLLSIFFREIQESFDQCLYSYFGINCLSHLAKVAAGLDSAIVAETEIQRQVKAAYSEGMCHQAMTKEIHFLFQKALRIAKEVRRHLPQTPHSSSLKGVIWEQIRKQDSWPPRKALFIGNSEINRDLFSYLRRKGMQQADLYTRYLQNRLFCRAVGQESLKDWDQYDLIFAASRAAHCLLHWKPTVRQPCMIFDLGVPRNVDPAIATLRQVRLFNIEEIDEQVKQNRFLQQAAIERCEAKIRDHAQRLCKSYRKRCLFAQPCSTWA